MSGYRYLLWDLDGTILDFLASEAYAINTLFSKYGLGPCTEEKLKTYSDINRKYWEALERNEMTKSGILVGRFREFFSMIGVDPSIAERFNKDYQEALGDHIVFIDHALDVLKSEKGAFTLAAVTNGTKVAQTKKLKRSGLDVIFDEVFISEDVGAEKPNVEYFDSVFEKLGVFDRGQALIIGDSLTSDMKGGAIAGVDTCWFNPKHKINDQGIRVTYEVDDLRAIKELIM